MDILRRISEVFGIPLTKVTDTYHKVKTPPTGEGLRQWAEAIKKHEGYYPGSRSYRNNNPGNFRCTPYIMSLGATKCIGNFAVFPTYEAGWSALLQFLKDAQTNKLRAYRGTMSLVRFFEVYAPASDNNAPREYAQAVADRVGVSLWTPIQDIY
jgi:hypothetical protein